jgi:hypothetical protein
MQKYLLVYMRVYGSDDQSESSLGMVIRARNVAEAIDLCEEQEDCCYVLAAAAAEKDSAEACARRMPSPSVSPHV